MKRLTNRQTVVAASGLAITADLAYQLVSHGAPALVISAVVCSLLVNTVLLTNSRVVASSRIRIFACTNPRCDTSIVVTDDNQNPSGFYQGLIDDHVRTDH